MNPKPRSLKVLAVPLVDEWDISEDSRRSRPSYFKVDARIRAVASIEPLENLPSEQRHWCAPCSAGEPGEKWFHVLKRMAVGDAWAGAIEHRSEERRVG